MDISCFTFTTLWVKSADDNLVTFSYFSQKTSFVIQCRLETNYMIFFFVGGARGGVRGNKKNISKCRLLKMISVNYSKEEKPML